jgi:hypothetical protein
MGQVAFFPALQEVNWWIAAYSSEKEMPRDAC